MKKSKAGRPTSYKPEYAEELIEYFSEPPYKETMKTVVTKLGDVLEVPTLEATDFKTLAGFAIKIGVCKDTLHEWSKVHPEFSDAYKRAKEFQENFLAVNGNKGLINPAFSIFTAKNVLKWRDKQPEEVDQVNVNIQSSLADRLSKAKARKK